LTMRKFLILTLVLVLAVPTLSAQVASSSQKLTYQGGGFYVNGVRLEKENLMKFLSEPATEIYNQAHHERVVGYVCTPVGVLALFGGSVILQQGISASKNPDLQALGGSAILGPLGIGLGSVCIGAGVACVTTGIVYLCRAHKTMLKVADVQNNPGKAITLSPSNNGLGLALNF